MEDGHHVGYILPTTVRLTDAHNAFVADHVLEWGKNADVGVLHAYCNWIDSANQSAAQVIGALIELLAEQRVDILKSIRKAFEAATRLGEPMSLDHLLQLLIEISSLFAPSFVFIEPLDKSENAYHRHRKQLFKAVARLHSSRIRFLAMSRPSIAKIKSTFATAVKLDVSGNEADVRRAKTSYLAFFSIFFRADLLVTLCFILLSILEII